MGIYEGEDPGVDAFWDWYTTNFTSLQPPTDIAGKLDTGVWRALEAIDHMPDVMFERLLAQRPRPLPHPAVWTATIYNSTPLLNIGGPYSSKPPADPAELVSVDLGRVDTLITFDTAENAGLFIEAARSKGLSAVRSPGVVATSDESIMSVRVHADRGTVMWAAGNEHVVSIQAVTLADQIDYYDHDPGFKWYEHLLSPSSIWQPPSIPPVVASVSDSTAAKLWASTLSQQSRLFTHVSFDTLRTLDTGDSPFGSHSDSVTGLAWDNVLD